MRALLVELRAPAVEAFLLRRPRLLRGARRLRFQHAVPALVTPVLLRMPGLDPLVPHADKGYDYPCCRRALSRRRIKVRIARRGVESSEKLGRHRWVVERTLAWLSQMRRLRVRYERRDDIHEALVALGCGLITWRAVQRYCLGL